MHLVENDILIAQFASLLREGKQVEFTPTGTSMRPFIEGGCDSVLLVSCPQARVGDICLAHIGEIYVLHRVVRVCEDKVILMGDGNLCGEEVCHQKDIVAKVVAIYTPSHHRKPLTNGCLWHHLFLPRCFWLKVYRHTLLKLYK